KVSETEALPILAAHTKGFKIQRAENDGGILFHHRRQVEDGELLFLVNTSITTNSVGVIESHERGVERWDADSGKTELYPFEKKNDGVEAKFDLPPAGSLLLFLSKVGKKAAPVVTETVATFNPASAPEIKRIAPNVLTLDYVDITAGGETKKNIY